MSDGREEVAAGVGGGRVRGAGWAREQAVGGEMGEPFPGPVCGANSQRQVAVTSLQV